MKTKKWKSHYKKEGSIIKIAAICLLLVITLITSRCAKDRLVNDAGGIKTLSVNSPDLKNRLDVIKNTYEQQKLQQKLQSDQSDKLSWMPDWEHPKIQVVNDSVSYVFYQLLGQVVVNGKREIAKQINGKLYLMVKNESEFYKAFYYDPKANPNEKIGKGTKEFDLKLFTGNLILSSLQNGNNYLLDYSNGHLSDSYQKKGVLAVKKMQSVKGTTSYWEQQCEQVVRNCTFSSLAPSWCGGTVNIVFSPNCYWPSSTCGDTYSLVDSDEGVVCEDRWFPDPPEPIDTGGGTSGNSEGTTPAEEFNKRITLDDLSPCAASVMYSLMYQTEGSVVSMIQKFSGEIPGYGWTLKSGSLKADTNGETKKSNGGATTIIDVSKYSNGTDMALARTLLHEAVHAYLVSYFANNAKLANISYAEMLAEWDNLKIKEQNLNNVQHIQITTEFKNDIAKGLMEYGDLHNYTFSSVTEKSQFYSDMAWGGLEATPAYKALSATEKDRIQDTIQAEQYGTDRNGDAKAGKGKPSGC